MESRIFEKYNDLITSIHKKSKIEVVDAKFHELIKLMIDYCSTEGSLFKVYRILKRIEADVNINLQKSDLTPHELLSKLLFYIKAEVDIVIYQFNNPDLIDRFATQQDLPKQLQWTDDKIALVELIYAILPSVNNGKTSVKSICDCFAFIFQIDLKGSYRMFIDINLRKTDVTRYLDSLPNNLQRQLDKLNEKS